MDGDNEMDVIENDVGGKFSSSRCFHRQRCDYGFLWLEFFILFS